MVLVVPGGGSYSPVWLTDWWVVKVTGDEWIDADVTVDEGDFGLDA